MSREELQLRLPVTLSLLAMALFAGFIARWVTWRCWERRVEGPSLLTDGLGEAEGMRCPAAEVGTGRVSGILFL